MTLLILTTILSFAAIGCQGHQSNVDALQKKYDQLGTQFQKDCSAEYLKIPPTLSPKCASEKDDLEKVGKQLQSERGKE
jgi:hypothetical protein